MTTAFPDDDWTPEEEALFADIDDDEAEFIVSAFMDYLSFVLPEDEIDSMVADFGDVLGATPDGVPPYEEG